MRRSARGAAVAGALAGADPAKVVACLLEDGVRAAVVAAGADLVADEHLADRGFFPEVAHPALGTARVVGLPWRFAGQGPLALTGPPALGSTTLEDVMDGVGGCRGG